MQQYQCNSIKWVTVMLSVNDHVKLGKANILRACENVSPWCILYATPNKLWSCLQS